MNKRRIFAVFTAFIIICFIPSLGAKAEDKKTVRIACGINTYLYLDENGEQAGYFSEYLRLLEKANNWEFEYVDAGWTEAVDMLERGEIDILFPTSYIPGREETMDFSELSGGYNISGLFVEEDSAFCYEDYAGFDGATVAVTKGSSNEKNLEDFAAEKGFGYTPVYINTVEEKVKALKQGKVDMAFLSASNNVPGTKLTAILEAEPFYFTVKKGNALLVELNSGMEKILMSEPAVVADVFSSCMAAANRSRLAFTAEENEFIESGNEIKVGFYAENAPLAYIGGDGKYNGIYVKILEKAAETSGAKITPYPISPDENWRALLDSGEIDFYIGASEKLLGYDSGYVCTDAFMDYEIVLVTKNNYTNISGGDKIRKLALTNSQAYLVDMYPEKFVGAEIIYCRTAKDCLLAVKNGQADMTPVSTIEYNYQSKNSRFSELVQRENYKYSSETVIAAAGNSDKLKLSVIGKAVNSLSDEEIKNITDVCMNMPYEDMTLADYFYSARYMLVLIGSIVVLAASVFLIRYTTFKKQRNIENKNREHEKRQLRIMSALSYDYVSVYYVNLESDILSVEKLVDPTRVSLVTAEDGSYTYSRIMRTYANKYVLPEYKSEFYKITDIEGLKKRLKKEKFFLLRYKALPTAENRENFEICFSEVSGSDSEHIMVMGFRCIDDIVREEIKQKRIMDETDEKLRRQMSIVGSLSSIYFATFTGDIVNNRIKEVDIPAYAHAVVDESDGELEKALDIMISRFIHKSSADRMRDFVDFSTLPEHIGPRNIISCEYMDIHSKWRRFNIIPMERDESGRVIKAVFTIQKIDEEKQKELNTQEALHLAFEAANKANNAKSDFLSKMSHDMRTPMNAIIGMTTIAEAHIDEKARVLDCLKKITLSSRHLLSLINEVLDMSKIESGVISLAEEDINLPELISETIEILKPDIEKHGHRFSAYINDIVHENVVGDSLRIQQVILNIIGNAIKYTPDGGSIGFAIGEQPAKEYMMGCYEFVFEDSGIGMSEDFMEHIFEPFSRAEDVRISKIQGTGLGMSITQNIVHMMNGDIRVESQIGKGSKFTVTLILKLQDKSEEISAEELAGLSVLVADDDKVSCESVCKMLDGMGMKSEWTCSGTEAVKRAEEKHKDGGDFYAILVDWKMPEMNGAETAKALRKSIGGKTPVIIMSAYDRSDIEAEAKDAGVTAFLSKPVFKSQLVRLLKKIHKGGSSLDNDGADTPEANELNVLSKSDFSGETVLLAEDNELNREIAVEILEMTGLKVECAENGKEALEMFAASPVDYYSMVFMDIQMPVMNGYESASAMRALDREDAYRVAIVAMTANAFTEDIQSSKRAGMNEHLAKPIEVDALMAVLRKYLRQK